jgi:hypothetical protein
MLRLLMSRLAPALFLVCATASLAAGPPAQATLDSMLTAYAAGDYAVLERALPRSADFAKYRLRDTKRLERWLGAWSRPKAAMLIEIVDRSSRLAPAYTIGLLTTGQQYVMSRTAPPGSSAADDALERRWHLIGLAALTRAFRGAEVVRYVDNLQARRPFPANAVVWDPRVHLARGVGQEQSCRELHATARHDRVMAELEGASSTPPAERSAAIECVQVALSFLEGAASHAAVREEARTRAGFALFQLGRNPEAKDTLDAVVPGDDRMVAYWRQLFRGRVADALEAPVDAERAYRDALSAFPDAHSASIGLALALFRLHREDEAEAAVKALRQRSIKAVDPWDLYYTADARFIDQWIAELREGRQ